MTQKRPNKQHSRNRRPQAGKANDAPRAPHKGQAANTASKPAGRSSGKPTGKSFTKPTGKPFDKAASKPAGKPVSKPFDKPDAKPENKKSNQLNGQIIYGVHAVKSAFENPKRRILRMLATEQAASAFDVMTSLKRPEFEIIEPSRFNDLMPEGAVHQGIAAVVEPLDQLDVRDLIDALEEGEDAAFVILDQVSDPHNVGAILRSACAFGAKGLIMQDKGAPTLSGVLAKTASGAADVLPVAHEVNLSRCIELLKENGFFVIGLDERGDNIANLPRYARVALVMGAEGAGLRRLVGEHCDLLASLPTSGKILSLNVSNAAAVALYATLFK